MEPVAAVEVKDPGVIAMVVAPLVAQLKEALAPELIAVGFAEKEEIAGTDPCPCGDMVEQPANAAQARKIRSPTPRGRSECAGIRDRRREQQESEEFKRSLLFITALKF